MKYVGTLIVVKNIEKSKKFYKDILGLNIKQDFGDNVMLECGISLQTLNSWQSFYPDRTPDIHFYNNACELYFEEDDIDKFIIKLNKAKEIKLVHPLKKHSWGQRVVRFYDPDGHIIEVGESISKVIKKFLDSGLLIEETAIRMDVDIDYIKSFIN